MTGLTVVCADPDADEREETCAALADAGHEAVASGSVTEAVDAVGSAPVDCVVTEYSLPDGTGLELVERVRDLAPDTPCVLFTNASPSHIETADRETVVEYLPKDMPDTRSSLVRLVGNVVDQRTQVAYPLPPDEDERLAALARYDRPGMDASTAFDRLTDLAQSHFGVDVAFAGLVDAHEERFLACAGADWETLAREDTMCTHTITEEEMLVVEDLAADPRFADSDRLADLNIEAYAGVPLTTPQGAAIGAFCLINEDPRPFSEAELADLQRFGDEAMEQLELRRRLVEADGGDEPGDGPGGKDTPSGSDGPGMGTDGGTADEGSGGGGEA